MRIGRAATLSLVLSLATAFAGAAQEIPPPDASLVRAPRTLLLDVIVNGYALKDPAELTYDPITGRLSGTELALTSIGVRLPTGGKPDDVVRLDDLGLDYRYEQETSRLYLALSDTQRLTKTYSARAGRGQPAPQSDWGAVVNYSLFGGYVKAEDRWSLGFSGANLTVDARLLTPFGVFTQTGMAGWRYADWRSLHEPSVARLDSTFAYADPDGPTLYRAGDVISGSLSWTRPIRLGGLQMQREWGLRSDMVTAPLPFFAGSAAVPSTVDVYVNGAKAFSQEVDEGPFRIDHLPTSGTGEARVVVRDVTGREVETSLPLFATSRMLAPGLWDYSLEGGFARRSFGLAGDDYDGHVIGSASVRYGLLPWLTLEAHAEGGAGLVNGGAGALLSLPSFGQITASVAGSRYGGYGAQSGVTWQGVLPYNLRLSLGTQRAIGPYEDLASVTARWSGGGCPLGDPDCLLAAALGQRYDPRPPKSVDRASLSIPMPFDGSTLSVGFVEVRQAGGEVSRLVTGSYARRLPWDATLFATVYSDFGDRRSTGAYFGISFPLGERARGSFSAIESPDVGQGVAAEASRSIRDEDGDYGWRVRAAPKGASKTYAASAAYRSSVGRVEAALQGDGARLSGTAQVEGSLALMGGGVFLGNTVPDSFAVVDAQAPGVRVLRNNRVVGRTNGSGKLIIPNLRAHEENRIAIEPQDLPLDADIEETELVVVPGWRSGAMARFGVRVGVASATVVLSDSAGKPIEVGAQGRLESSGERFVVGYDGRAYVKGLQANNTVVISVGENECRAAFAYAPTAEDIPELHAVCR